MATKRRIQSPLPVPPPVCRWPGSSSGWIRGVLGSVPRRSRASGLPGVHVPVLALPPSRDARGGAVAVPPRSASAEHRRSSTLRPSGGNHGARRTAPPVATDGLASLAPVRLPVPTRGGAPSPGGPSSRHGATASSSPPGGRPAEAPARVPTGVESLDRNGATSVSTMLRRPVPQPTPPRARNPVSPAPAPADLLLPGIVGSPDTDRARPPSGTSGMEPDARANPAPGNRTDALAATRRSRDPRRGSVDRARRWPQGGPDGPVRSCRPPAPSVRPDPGQVAVATRRQDPVGPSGHPAPRTPPGPPPLSALAAVVERPGGQGRGGNVVVLGIPTDGGPIEDRSRGCLPAPDRRCPFVPGPEGIWIAILGSPAGR